MKTTFKNFTLTSTFLGNKEWSENDRNWNNHRITVYNRDTKKRTSFEFWGSIMNPKIRTNSELGFAFYCFLSDAVSSIDYSYNEFCQAFGYDEYTSQAKRVYRACKKSAEKVQRILGTIDLYDLLNEVQEKYNC